MDWELLPDRPCSKAELHIDPEVKQDSSPFYHSHPSYLKDLQFLSKKLKCLDIDQPEVQGDYNSPKARSLVFRFEKCSHANPLTPDDIVCKSDEEIKAWLKRKFIVVYYN